MTPGRTQNYHGKNIYVVLRGHGINSSWNRQVQHIRRSNNCNGQKSCEASMLSNHGSCRYHHRDEMKTGRYIEKKGNKQW